MPLTDLTTTPLPRLTARPADSHKGDFGRALLVGGSRGMSGAIALAGMATLRSGAGLVTLAVPRSIQNLVASVCPCYMTHGLDDDDGHFAHTAERVALGHEFTPTACAIGPGMGRTNAVMDLVDVTYRESDLPVVFDADALFALATRQTDLLAAAGPRVLTPHPGEFSRLTKFRYDVANRLNAAVEYMQRFYPRRHPLILVLKGHETIVTDGQRYSINQTGNPGMATGGTGDVLTGVITALLCQGLSPFDAARLGVHVHGLAGDLAATQHGQISLIASDLLDYLPEAFQTLPRIKPSTPTS
jgi:ADP-dependent NAD(P)H-hydrate dehydratase